MVATLIIAAVSNFTLPQIMFEVLSALSTVGLSTGITPQMPIVGKVVLIILMIMGRLGPMTIAFALLEKLEGNGHVRLPKAHVMIG